MNRGEGSETFKSFNLSCEIHGGDIVLTNGGASFTYTVGSTSLLLQQQSLIVVA